LPALSPHADRMTESAVTHAAFRLEHTVRWNPSVPFVRSIEVDPPVSLEDARRLVAENIPSLTKAGVWSLMDGAQLVRAVDIVAIRVVPVSSTPDDHGVGFGLTAVEGD
jgi:hypothetical protein